MDVEVNVLEQQKKALGKGGRQAEEVARQLASWQAGMPQAAQPQVQLPKGVMSFPVTKTRAASAVNGSVDRGSAKKKAKEDGLQADLQKGQTKNPIQVCVKTLPGLHDDPFTVSGRVCVRCCSVCFCTAAIP